MCTLFIYRSKNSDWPILIANNRDEYYSRSFFSPGFHWKNYNYIFAGKDLLQGGTWLGVNKYGLCVCVLNRTSDLQDEKDLYSRGNLIINCLKHRNASEVKSFLKNKFKKNTRFFNMFISDYKNAFWAKFFKGILKIAPIPFGHSIIDNYDLNDSKSVKQILYKKIFMQMKTPDPNINYFEDWEKMLFLKKKYKNNKLSSVYIENSNKNYGTVCSSIIGLPNRNRIKDNIFWLYSEKKNSYKKLLPFKN